MKIAKKIILFGAAVLICPIFSSCSKKNAADSASVVQFARESPMAFKEMSDEDFAEAKVSKRKAVVSGNPQADAFLSESGEISADKERKLIKNGSVSVEVESLKAARETAENWVKSFGGFITNSNESGNFLSIVARIPSARFDEAMKATGEFGKTLSRNVSSTDVTEQFYDLESRLGAKEIMLGRLNSYLTNAKDIKDMLEIETKLNEVTADLESMRSRMKHLSGQIEFSTISISATLPVNRTEEGFVLPDAKSKMRKFAGNVLEFFVSLLFFVLYAIVFGIPIVFLAAVVFLLTFGKIGLVRRLFAKFRK